MDKKSEIGKLKVWEKEIRNWDVEGREAEITGEEMGLRIYRKEKKFLGEQRGPDIK